MKQTIFLFLVLVLASCGDDDNSKGSGASTKGVFTIRKDGATWTSGEVKRVNYSSASVPSEQFTAYSDTDKSVIYIDIPTANKTPDTYVIPGPISIGYYGDIKQSSTWEDATEGQVIIKKYTTDSLVLDFNFKTPTYTFTEGKVKLKLN